MKRLVVDAAGARLGRLSSFAAKQALLGNEVIIVNCSAAVITGNRRSVIEDYKHTRQRGGSSLRGPNFPQNPSRIMKRTIRGMLSYKQGRGAAAFKRIKCFDSVPAEFAAEKKPFTAQKPTLSRTITMEDLSSEI